MCKGYRDSQCALGLYPADDANLTIWCWLNLEYDFDRETLADRPLKIGRHELTNPNKAAGSNEPASLVWFAC